MHLILAQLNRFWLAVNDDVMLFLAECIRIFTTWQAISFNRKFYLILWRQQILQFSFVTYAFQAALNSDKY